MNGKELLMSLGNIGHKYYDEAENEMPRRRIIRSPLLIAAIIALAALLVGCAVVYALRLQDMSIGQETYTQSFDEKGKAIAPTEKTRDIITIYGHSGDNIQLALKDWFDFLETYDPDGALSDNNPDHAEIPNQYEFTYGCYTLDMAAKVDEIAAKYDLKLLDEWLPFQAWQSEIFLEESGIGSFLLPGSTAEVDGIAGMFYPPHNFDMSFELSTDAVDVKLWVTARYARKDYFPSGTPGGIDLSQFEQWDYTAPDGTPLLLARSSKGQCYIIGERDNAMLVYYIDGNFSGSAYPEADEIITKEQLEAVADLFDYSIKPHVPDRTVVEQRLEASQEEYDAAHAYVPETFGSFSEVLKARFIIPNELAQYAFYDLTGDGTDELLISLTGNGSISEWLTVQDGEVISSFSHDLYICEGRVLELYYEDPERPEQHKYHRYLKAENETGLLDTNPETDGEAILFLALFKGKWTKANDMHAPEQTEISEAEAQEILARYPRIELDWNPVMDYPISETQTLRQSLEAQDVRVSNEEVREIYRTYLLEKETLHYTHYRILDINGDGLDDLLLKGEDDAFIGKTDFYWIALTYRYGHIEGLVMDFYLCEDGVIEKVSTRHNFGIGVEVNGHQFMRLADLNEVLLDFVAYNKATASWQGDWWNEKPLTEAEANAVLEKYPRIDQGMRPISELLN